MALERTTAALSAISDHVRERETDGVIENFLVQHVAIILYSDMEENIGIIIRDYILACSNEKIADFLRTNMDSIIRRTSKSDISKLVRQFGEPFKQRFESQIEDRTVTSYSNVIEARHATGHRQGSNITLSEVRVGLDAAKSIIQAINNCLYDTV